MPKAFRDAIKHDQSAFGFELTDAVVDRLIDYYHLVQEHNPLLHLVAPCSPEEFAIRHILESLTLLEHLPPNAKFADVGPGAGLPSIPCLLARNDLTARLIESKEKKAMFLKNTIAKLSIEDRVDVINKQFDETGSGDAYYIACRALDKFIDKLPRLVKWAGRRTMLLFGGPALAAALTDHQQSFTQRLMPLSERRFLFIVDRDTS